VDPVNDRDLWTIQEYARLRVGTTGQGTNDSRWGTWWAMLTAPAGAGDLLISEFRLRGPSGANDEFVEIYNPNSSPLTVTTADGSSGYALVASAGSLRFIIPNGTVIPARGHFLGVNGVAYSLGSSAAGDATYTADIPDNIGIALFASSNQPDFTLANRIDAVGSTSEALPLYKEGTGYPALTPFSIDYSFYRSFCPFSGGVFGTAMGCSPGSGGLPKDSDNNAADFVFVDTNGTSAGAGQRLGAPGPENLASPLDRNAQTTTLVVDASQAASLPPNRVRDFTSDPPNNSTFGTLDIRRRVVNNTGAPVTRLRFRVIDINTFPAPSGFADLRTRTSGSVVVSGVNDASTCSPNPAPCSITIQGTTLEQPPSQPNGGAFNSTYGATTITLGTPLANGASINIRFLLGIQQTGNFRFFLNVEALP
ncbi:MAG TPA: lamin tail domain-containing protein, partial [Pyrinomonadaceae bacterium]